MKVNEQPEAKPDEHGRVQWTDFLAHHPPAHNEGVIVIGCAEGEYLKRPEIYLYCEECEGTLGFEAKNRSNDNISWDSPTTHVLNYRCKNCEKTTKQFVVRLSMIRRENQDDLIGGTAYKIGEFPPHRPRVPNAVLRRFDTQEKLFLHGLSAESQGLGIGAFAYYRRIVENSKDAIIDMLIKVAQRQKADESVIKIFEEAKKKVQFMSAIEDIQDHIPETLIIDGHNPLLALHKALSDGLHAKTDEECLSFAQTIRIVLVELSERVNDVLKKHTVFEKAVGALLRAHGDHKAESGREKEFVPAPVED